MRGCDNDVPEYEIEGIKLTRCPLSFLGRKCDIYFRAYSFLMNGHFTFTGGWGEQPNILIESSLFIDSEFNRIKENGK